MFHRIQQRPQPSNPIRNIRKENRQHYSLNWCLLDPLNCDKLIYNADIYNKIRMNNNEKSNRSVLALAG